MINVRWGKAAHITFLIFGIMTNIIVSSMLLLGGCAVMEAAAGIDIRLSGFLIPLGTLVYTLVGGLKATFLASYLFSKEQCNSLGSASLVYERLMSLNALPTRIG